MNRLHRREGVGGEIKIRIATAYDMEPKTKYLRSISEKYNYVHIMYTYYMYICICILYIYVYVYLCI